MFENDAERSENTCLKNSDGIQILVGMSPCLDPYWIDSVYVQSTYIIIQLLSDLSVFILGQYIRNNDIQCIRLKHDKWYLMIILKNVDTALISICSVLAFGNKMLLQLRIPLLKQTPLSIFTSIGSTKNKCSD